MVSSVLSQDMTVTEIEHVVPTHHTSRSALPPSRASLTVLSFGDRFRKRRGNEDNERTAADAGTGQGPLLRIEVGDDLIGSKPSADLGLEEEHGCRRRRGPMQADHVDAPRDVEDASLRHRSGVNGTCSSRPVRSGTSRTKPSAATGSFCKQNASPEVNATSPCVANHPMRAVDRVPDDPREPEAVSVATVRDAVDLDPLQGSRHRYPLRRRGRPAPRVSEYWEDRGRKGSRHARLAR
jgi:hypothetical protein